MNAINRTLSRLLAALTVLAAVTMGRTACAQGRFGRDVFVPMADSPTILLTDAQFEQWAFHGLSADEFRARLERRLTARVNEIHRICPLTEAQRKKLNLAGLGDIRHFFADVEKIKQTIRDRQIDPAFGVIMFPDSRPSEAVDRKTFFGPESLLGKSLRNTLGSEQFTRYERIQREEHAARHRATLKWVVGILDTTLHLNAEQHRRLTGLLAEETRPPRTFGEYDYYGVMFQMSLLPDARLKPIFEPAQWAKLEVHLHEATRLKKTLEERGFVPEDGVAAQASAHERDQDVPQKKKVDGQRPHATGAPS